MNRNDPAAEKQPDKAKKQKKLLLIGVAVILLLLLLVVILASGGSGTEDTPAQTEPTEPAEINPVLTEPTLPESDNAREARQRLETFFQAYTSCDGALAGEILEGMGQPLAIEGIGKQMAQQTIALVLWPVQEEEAAVCFRVCMEMVDMVKVMESVPEDVASEADARAYLNRTFADEDLAKEVFYPEVWMRLVNGQWYVTMTTDLSNAMTGGLAEWAMQMDDVAMEEEG